MADQTAMFRPCCRDAAVDLGPAAPVFHAEAPLYLTQADASAPTIDLPITTGDRVIAHHESGHVAIAIAAGGSVRRVTIANGLYLAETRLPGEMLWRLNVAFSLAGDIAGRWSRKWAIPLHPMDIDWTLQAVRNCGGGRCDICMAIRTATVQLKHPSNDVIIAEIRRIEAATTAFVQTPRNWHFIRRLAAMLIEHGTVTGAEIAAEFGRFEFDLTALAGLDPASEKGGSDA